MISDQKQLGLFGPMWIQQSHSDVEPKTKLKSFRSSGLDSIQTDSATGTNSLDIFCLATSAKKHLSEVNHTWVSEVNIIL